MTDRYDRDRILGTDAILQEVRQFRNLEPLGLDDAEIAHRMAATPKEVMQIRNLVGSGKVRLSSLAIAYHTRFLLGTKGIKTIGTILSKTDKELLSIKGIGPKTLSRLKEAICTFMEATNG